ncbi:MAG TPA: glycosyltransferase family 2 protein [Candidatus Nanoarchaeia archaeon]|nr:glycosyltransferase family 2 protein [Candidatus Nanoarchaeia archaeon]
MKIIVTIPAYNEERSIGKVISEVNGVMKSNKYNFSVLVVDDGSKDKTREVAQDAGAIVYSHPINYGLAETFKTEVRQCVKLGADIIVHFDADGQYLAEDIPKLVEEVKNGNDLVLGSRFRGKIEEMSLLRRIGNIMFSKVISQVTRMRVSDAQTGFRAFTKEAAERIAIISNFTYTQEQIIRAAREKFRIKEVPITFAKRRHGKSRLFRHPLTFALRAGINILRIYRDYEPLKFFGAFGALFFVPGFLIGLWLVYLFLTTGVVGRLPFAMLTVLLISIGAQIWLFGFLADMMRK